MLADGVEAWRCSPRTPYLGRDPSRHLNPAHSPSGALSARGMMWLRQYGLTDISLILSDACD